MPTYQYACTACGHRFEAVQSFSDASLSECPECSGKLRKLFGSVGVVFKGSGFYRTDSRESAKKASTPTNGSSTNGSESSEKSSSTEKSGASEKSSSSDKSASSEKSTSSASSTAAASS